MWYLSRSTGIVAAVLSVASLLWGLLFSSRNTGNRRRPNWWLSLHNWLGGLTLGFIGLHMLVSVLDTDAGLRVIDLFVPSGEVGWAIGWGVIATWLFAVVVLPSVTRVRRRLPRKAWHLVHLLALPAIALTAVHGYQSGSDTSSVTGTRTLALLVGIAVYALAIRVASLGSPRRRLGAS